MQHLSTLNLTVCLGSNVLLIYLFILIFLQWPQFGSISTKSTPRMHAPAPKQQSDASRVHDLERYGPSGPMSGWHPPGTLSKGIKELIRAESSLKTLYIEELFSYIRDWAIQSLRVFKARLAKALGNYTLRKMSLPKTGELDQMSFKVTLNPNCSMILPFCYRQASSSSSINSSQTSNLKIILLKSTAIGNDNDQNKSVSCQKLKLLFGFFLCAFLLISYSTKGKHKLGISSSSCYS